VEVSASTIPGQASAGSVTDGQSPPDTRARILGHAVSLIASKGFAGTSTRELCERMGFTKAALWYHFKSKDELLEALLAPLTGALEALVSGRTPQPAADQRRAVAVAYVDLVAGQADLMRVLYDDPAVRGSAPMAAARPLYAQLFRLLAGTAAPDTAALARGRAAVGAVHAALLRGEPDEDLAVLRAAAAAAACGALGIPPPLDAPVRTPRVTSTAARHPRGTGAS
jgi:AcrR family transcriptional regulator